MAHARKQLRLLTRAGLRIFRSARTLQIACPLQAGFGPHGSPSCFDELDRPIASGITCPAWLLQPPVPPRAIRSI